MAAVAVLAFLGVDALSRLADDAAQAGPARALSVSGTGPGVATAPMRPEPDRRPQMTRVSLGGAPATGPCAPRQGPDGARAGDQIALRVFEANSGAGAGATTATARFERRDLGGTVPVEVTGEISIPGVGRLQAAGLTLACLEQRIAARLQDELGVDAALTASFAARPPVLIQGLVGAPGSYDYAPGLTVRRLLAQSGLAEPGRDEARRRQALMSRREELVIRRDGLDLALTRLRAHRDEQKVLALDEDGEARFQDTLGVERIEGEAQLLDAEVEADTLRSRSAAARRAELLEARDMAVAQRDTTQASFADLVARRDDLADELSRDCRGRCGDLRLTKEMRLDSLENRTIDMDILRQQQVIAVSAAEAALKMHDRQVEAQLAEARQEIVAAIGRTLEDRLAVLAQIDAADQELAQLNPGTEALTFTVEGLIDGQAETFAATLDTALMPGDLVSVSLRPGGIPEDQRAEAEADAVTRQVTR